VGSGLATGRLRAAEGVFDVFARQAEDLVPPLVRIGMSEQPARALAARTHR